MEVQGAPRLQRSPAAPAVAATQGALDVHWGGGACARCNGSSVVCPRGRHTPALHPPSSWKSLLPLYPVPCTCSLPEHDCDSGKGPGVAVRKVARRRVHASIYRTLCTRPYLQCFIYSSANPMPWHDDSDTRSKTLSSMPERLCWAVHTSGGSAA